MLKAAIIQKLVVGVLGATLASSGLAYAGVSGVPNPVQAVVDAATQNDDVESADVEATDEVEGEESDLPQEAEDGQATAQQKREGAEGYTAAVREWTTCVKEAAEAQGSDETRTEEAFDPKAACGERPQPQNFGLTEVPDQASEEGKQHSEEGQQKGSDVRTEHQPDDAPDQDQGGSSNETSGQSTDTPNQDSNPSQDAPKGRP